MALPASFQGNQVPGQPGDSPAQEQACQLMQPATPAGISAAAALVGQQLRCRAGWAAPAISASWVCSRAQQRIMPGTAGT